jgi:hypothetical protein
LRFADVSRHRQVAFPILRPQIIAAPLTLPGAGTLGAKAAF